MALLPSGFDKLAVSITVPADVPSTKEWSNIGTGNDCWVHTCRDVTSWHSRRNTEAERCVHLCVTHYSALQKLESEEETKRAAFKAAMEEEFDG